MYHIACCSHLSAAKEPFCWHSSTISLDAWAHRFVSDFCQLLCCNTASLFFSCCLFSLKLFITRNMYLILLVQHGSREKPIHMREKALEAAYYLHVLNCYWLNALLVQSIVILASPQPVSQSAMLAGLSIKTASLPTNKAPHLQASHSAATVPDK